MGFDGREGPSYDLHPSSDQSGINLHGCTDREGEAAVTALAAALRDDDVRARESAARGLAHAAAWSKVALPALIERLEDTNESVEVKRVAAVSLGTLRSAGRDGLFVLRKMTEAPDEGLRRSAARAIQRIDNPNAEFPCDE